MGLYYFKNLRFLKICLINKFCLKPKYSFLFSKTKNKN